ncbi:Tn3 family transposase [Nonomuraea ceibae]|uniref:Tn3 family transposase n=1 Tax=Nonomuraea ceibae TaxID=1935170 RepID=UPI0035592236
MARRLSEVAHCDLATCRAHPWLLQFIADEGYRRIIGTQLNAQEARHRVARKIAFGNRGQQCQRYREGLGTSWEVWAWR